MQLGFYKPGMSNKMPNNYHSGYQEVIKNKWLADCPVSMHRRSFLYQP